MMLCHSMTWMQRTAANTAQTAATTKQNPKRGEREYTMFYNNSYSWLWIIIILILLISVAGGWGCGCGNDNNNGCGCGCN